MPKTLLLIATLFWAYSSQAEELLIYNLNGYLLEKDQWQSFKAIHINAGRIKNIYKASAAIPSSFQGKRLDGQGKTMLPGLIDAHGHIKGYALAKLQIHLRNSASAADSVKRVVAYRDRHPKLKWLQGRGWNQVLWPGKQFPTAAMLDKQIKDRPVWLRRVDGHAGWANSKAMQIAGISRTTPDPEGGQIIRDSKGNPTGTFIDNAMELISQHIPEISLQEELTLLPKALSRLAELGLTSVHDAGINSQTVAAYKTLANQAQLPIRVYAMLSGSDKNFSQLLKAGPFVTANDYLTIRSVKLFFDGALGSRGAALHDSYSDKHNHKGLLLYPPKQLLQLAKQAQSQGFQVNIHAIGDRGNSEALNIFQQLNQLASKQVFRHRIEHSQVIQLNDIPRFAQLNIIPSMQPIHATSDKNMAEDRLGPQRIKGAYAWRKLINHNARIAGGSDFPVEPANPFYGVHAAVTRQDHNNHPQKGWYPEEKLTVAEALKLFTYNAAYAAHQENKLGNLRPGHWADFVLLDQDPFTVDKQSLWRIQVTATWVAGKPVYQQPTTQLAKQ
ncbi:amidohydrolase [Spartinivicinus poritis]|uniref:Amidohydrolase n=1 Tax=Spartinivicinus poritis TaxID=2994640 RepID=A0ABT5U492_9GAMM|nr:amidohydrolase [Spartinivicinus sp. A2-2]MDE1461040.1 amidohydrolase [Spartinivicinus sp. A2-2]